jgi:hypothetical protein
MSSSVGRSVVIMSIRVESADCVEVGGAEFAAVHGDDDASGACDDGFFDLGFGDVDDGDAVFGEPAGADERNVDAESEMRRLRVCP